MKAEEQVGLVGVILGFVVGGSVGAVSHWLIGLIVGVLMCALFVRLSIVEVEVDEDDEEMFV